MEKYRNKIKNVLNINNKEYIESYLMVILEDLNNEWIYNIRKIRDHSNIFSFRKKICDLVNKKSTITYFLKLINLTKNKIKVKLN